MPRKTSPAAPKPAPAFNPAASMFDVAQQLRRWTDNVLGIAGSASDLSLNLAKARASEPRHQYARTQSQQPSHTEAGEYGRKTECVQLKSTPMPMKPLSW